MSALYSPHRGRIPYVSHTGAVPHGIHAVRVHRPTWIRDLGVKRKSGYAEGSQHLIEGCSIQPGERWEHNIRARNAVNRFSIYAPLDADIDADDRVSFTLGGRTFEFMIVDGNPDIWVDPRGTQSHVLFSVLNSDEADYAEPDEIHGGDLSG